MLPDVAESLDRDGQPLAGSRPSRRQASKGHDCAAAAGGRVAALAAAHAERLPRDHRGHGVAGLHRDRVHDPGHDLWRGVDVGGRDVPVGSDQHRDLARVAPRQALQLVVLSRSRVDDHAALGAAEGNPDHGALPGHPHRQRLDLARGDVRRDSGCLPWPDRESGCAGRGSPGTSPPTRRPS